jgi:cytochrome c oxidase subunit 3
MSSEAHGGDYVPHGSHWPFVGSIGLFTTMLGLANFLNGNWNMAIMWVGFAVLVFMLFGWFGVVIRESEGGYYNGQVDMSFRWGMGWFIFSEVMFFAAFFGALFYARQFALPWLSGEAGRPVTHEFLWPTFELMWPTNGPGEIGGKFEEMGPWPIPTINTLILLSSGVTVTFAHWAILANDRSKFVLWLIATVVLGFTFVGMQAYEYVHAYHELNLKLGTGIYGNTFFMLTGFHGLHVTIGATILTVIMLRAVKGHFSDKHHFGFEGAAWYWHFVDVVWLGLYIFVYWM